MDDISREPLPEHSGQGVVTGGQLRKGPAELARFVGDSPIDGLPEPAIDGTVHGVGSAQREELLIMLGDLQEDLQDGLREDLPDEVADELPDDELADGDDAPEADLTPAADQDPEPEAALPRQGNGLPPDQLPRVLCGVLLANREPVAMLRLAEATGNTVQAIREALVQLGRQLEHSELPLEVTIHGEQVALMTAPDIFDYVRSLRAVKKPEKLSSAALETLAVIAYRQPVIRAEIEAIRGVKAGPILKTLLEHRMIKSVGRAEVPGRPLQYGTTQHFLESFGLQSLKDLPSVKEFRAL